MSLWSRLFGREAKASGAGQVMAASYVGNPVWTPRNYARLAEESYVRNAVAYRCVKMIASGFAAMPWIAYSGIRERDDNDPLLRLLANPGPGVSGQQFFEAAAAYYLLSGNSYLESVGPNDAAPPQELWNQRPDRMKVVPGKIALPEAFTYEAGGLIKRWEVDPFTGRSPILHVKEFHPTNDWYGLPRVDPAAYAIDRHNAASAHNKALLDNGARPSGVLVFKPVMVNGSAQSAPQTIIEKAEEQLLERHVGPQRAGKPMVASGDVDWKEMGLSPRDMDFGAGKDDAARDITAAFGVPHILIVPGQATYNNLKEARLQLYEDTILPMASVFRQALNGWLAPRFGSRLRLEHDLDEIPALEPRREAKRKGTVELFKARIITRNEARDAMQYDAIEGEDGDAFDKPAATQPGGDPDQPANPADGDT